MNHLEGGYGNQDAVEFWSDWLRKRNVSLEPFDTCLLQNFRSRFSNEIKIDKPEWEDKCRLQRNYCLSLLSFSNISLQNNNEEAARARLISHTDLA